MRVPGPRKREKSESAVATVGAFRTWAFDMPVYEVMNEGMEYPGLTNVEKLSVGRMLPNRTRTAAIWIMSFATGENPVVSRSKITTSIRYHAPGCVFLCLTASFWPHIPTKSQ